VTLGAWYTLRLEAVGSALRTYVNGRLLLEANDSTYSEGSHGLATFRTSAQFDNFIATQP
jgi:pectate lyase